LYYSLNMLFFLEIKVLAELNFTCFFWVYHKFYYGKVFEIGRHGIYWFFFINNNNNKKIGRQ